MKTPKFRQTAAEKLRQDLADLAAEATSSPLAPRRRKQLDAQLRELMAELGRLLHELDPIRQPAAVFDPSNPKVVGRFISLALVAQPRQLLKGVEAFYGSGVYAIYYNGSFPSYAPITRSETPIYVGQAAPAMSNARTAMEQGDRLARRLRDHRSNISKATGTLNIDDFEYRALVVQSGWESAAEDFLIHLFRPVWNSETNILYGLGKHGDSAETRGNKRSPWDTLHPGRAWAAQTTEDARTPTQITADLQAHFESTKIYANLDEVLHDFIDELRQV
ncbi:MAG: Eco29kI family restriction endonuclease [Rhizobiaceae bacterium]|nr:Eco29kI family restriction endonuclease [Rhizobiaceae bacterium]MCV0405416.1 Eco29kI family restriction endonuclease [Rhizobiaceae bacterium]